MMYFSTPFEVMRSWHDAHDEYARMILSAGDVIRCRVTQMATGTMSAQEAARMVFEKPVAFARATEKAMLAGIEGRGHGDVALAAIRAIGVSTHSNAERLKRQG